MSHNTYGDRSEAITFGTRQKLRSYTFFPGIEGTIFPLSDHFK